MLGAVAVRVCKVVVPTLCWLTAYTNYIESKTMVLQTEEERRGGKVVQCYHVVLEGTFAPGILSWRPL